jgi:hypothetical protein
MSFEQAWSLPLRTAHQLFDAIKSAADRHDLRFWCLASSTHRLTLWVQFPVDEAAFLATEYSDIYDDPEEVAEELDALEGAVDWDTAEEMGAVIVSKSDTGLVSKRLKAEKAELFRAAPPTMYTCSFDVDFSRDSPVVVASSEDDNRAAWPLIIAFTDDIIESLGGELSES